MQASIGNRFLYTFVRKMKSRSYTYYPLFFTFCILASLFVGAYQNVNVSFSKSSGISYKNISFNRKSPKATQNDFLFEEKETESKTNVDLKLLTNDLPYLIAFFQFETLLSSSFCSQFLAVKQTNPIYISVCNWRI